LIAARREKHMETRVWVERRKAENWLARECLRHWRRTMKKQAHVSYLPIWKDGPEQSSRRDADWSDRDGRGPQKQTDYASRTGVSVGINTNSRQGIVCPAVHQPLLAQ
jgi:hypothetical protein